MFFLPQNPAVPFWPRNLNAVRRVFQFPGMLDKVPPLRLEVNRTLTCRVSWMSCYNPAYALLASSWQDNPLRYRHLSVLRGRNRILPLREPHLLPELRSPLLGLSRLDVGSCGAWVARGCGGVGSHSSSLWRFTQHVGLVPLTLACHVTIRGMTPQPEYHEWPTMQEAAQAIGCSQRTLARWVAEKKLQTMKVSRIPPGGKHCREMLLCHPSDVARLAGERQPQPFVQGDFVSAGSMDRLSNQAALAVGARPPNTQMLDVLQALGFYRNDKPVAVPISISQKAYLTLDEAVEYSGLPKAELLRMVQGVAPVLESRKCGRWYIRRKSLDAL